MILFFFKGPVNKVLPTVCDDNLQRAVHILLSVFFSLSLFTSVAGNLKLRVVFSHAVPFELRFSTVGTCKAETVCKLKENNCLLNSFMSDTFLNVGMNDLSHVCMHCLCNR